MAVVQDRTAPDLFTAGSSQATNVHTYRPFRVVIVMPVYRDWEPAALLCRAIEHSVSPMQGVSARVVLIDDGSPEGVAHWDFLRTETLTEIVVLRLRRNVGHQRAICAGLCYVHEHIACDAVLVMDADGEDRPEDVARLIDTAIAKPGDIIFAERRKRLEGIVFRLGYLLFRHLHRLLTGVSVRVGNFSIVPSSALSRLTSMPEMWNHYAGAIFKSKLPFETIPIDRGRRIRGRSQMNLTSLVTHGLSGIASFQETVATRLLIANAVCLLLLLAAIAVVIGIRLFTNLAVPGWATYTVGLMVILLTQILAVSFSLMFSLVSSRSNTVFIPSRDCSFFIDQLVPLATRK